jgi:hypothetical protein
MARFPQSQDLSSLVPHTHSNSADGCFRATGALMHIPIDFTDGTMVNVWNDISLLPFKFRKAIVLLCRAQCVPELFATTPLAIQAYGSLLTDIGKNTDHGRRFVALPSKIKDLVESPLYSGLILDICRSAPMERSMIMEQRMKSWGKEIAACEGVPLHTRINYRPFFDEDAFNEPILPYLPPNPDMARHVHYTLRRWRKQLEFSLIYPRMSRKQQSRSTRRHWEELEGRRWVGVKEGGVEFTQEVIEKYYHDTGIHLQGVCEVRQKWYKSGISPRTYFCQGGTTYEASKYLQEAFSKLADELICTNHVSRLNPVRINLEGDRANYLRIWDLTSFTSNHHECKHFIEGLAGFCYGTMVRIVDSREGVLDADLGVLLSNYNKICNFSPEYSLEILDEVFVGVTLVHHIAGFLGVYGNIASSAFLHGATVLQTCTGTDRLNVAGDDGHKCETPGLEDLTLEAIRANGIVERSKEFSTQDEGAVCLKRGIIQIDQSLIQKLMIVWPSFHSLGSILWYQAPQFQPFEGSNQDARDMVGTEILRFLQHIFACGELENVDSVLRFLYMFYLEANLPEYGELPQCGGQALIPILPRQPRDLFDMAPLQKLIRARYNGGALVNSRIARHLASDEEAFEPYAGYEWSGVSSRKVSFLRSLGYISSDPIKKFVYGESGLQELLDDFDLSMLSLYNHTVISDIPPYLHNL